jgi:hypothetical protein
LKGLTLAALLLPWVVFVGVQGGAGRPRFAVSLLLAGLLVVAAAGILDLVVKIAVGAEAPVWLWVGIVPMVLAVVVVFGKERSGWTRRCFRCW